MAKKNNGIYELRAAIPDEHRVISKPMLAAYLDKSERTIERMIQRGIIAPVPGRRPQMFDVVDATQAIIADLYAQMPTTDTAEEMGFASVAELIEAASRGKAGA